MMISINQAKPALLRKHSGFSLVETTLQLMVLSIVTLPMLMTLNLQNANTEENKRNVNQQVVANRLFDNILVQNPEAIDAYSVSQPVSIFCDPASMAKTPSEFTATCSQSGADFDKAPFFTRSIRFLSNQSGLVTEVNLFDSKTGQTPTTTFKRQYQLDAYRIHTGLADASTINNPQSSNFGTLIQVDNDNNQWYPDYTPNTASNLATYFSNPCTSTVGTVASQGVPFNQYRPLQPNVCDKSYTLKVKPEAVYDVNVYFSLPTTAGTTCMPNANNMSCALANVRVVQSIGDNSIVLSDHKNFDVSAATSMGDASNKGLIFHTQVRTVPAANQIGTMVVTVSPTPVGSTSVALSGIEVLRRPDY